MPRDLSASVITELSKASIKIAIFVEVNFASGPLYLWSGIGPIGWDTHTWTGTGSLLQVNPADESSDLRAHGIEVLLNGVDPAMLALALQEARSGKDVNCWLGFLDSSENIIADPSPFFKGKLDTLLIEEGSDTSTVKILAESKFIILQRNIIRRYTKEDQQSDYPSDLGFEHVSGLKSWQGDWGTADLAPPSDLSARMAELRERLERERSEWG